MPGRGCDSMGISDEKIPTVVPVDRAIVSAEANTGSPLKGDFERMARRRFQDPKPWRRGNWWTIQVRQDVVVNGKLQRGNKRVRLGPATMAEREVRKVAAEYLRPLNQGITRHWFCGQLCSIRSTRVHASGDAAFSQE